VVHELPDVIDVPSKQLGDGAFATVGEEHAFALHVHVAIDPEEQSTDPVLALYPQLHSVVHELPDVIDVP